MPVIGITGGIATGKTSFSRALLRNLPAQLFDADQAVHTLLAEDLQVRKAVVAAFGAATYSGGSPNRALLRELIFTDEVSRQRLEAILHPPVHALWSRSAQQASADGSWLLVDLPLLYETDSAPSFDRVVVVGCSPSVQRTRILSRRGLNADLADKMIGAQMPLENKIRLADHLIWNEASEILLAGQAELLTAQLHQTYG